MAPGFFPSTAAALLITAAPALSYSIALQTKRPVDQSSRPGVSPRWVGQRLARGTALVPGTAELGGAAAPEFGARP